MILNTNPYSLPNTIIIHFRIVYNDRINSNYLRNELRSNISRESSKNNKPKNRVSFKWY